MFIEVLFKGGRVMKKKTLILSILVLAMAMIAMVSCSSSSMVVNTIDEKNMEITAENAAKDDFALSGSLVIGADEQLVIDSNLEEGGLKIELIKAEEEQSEEELPDVDAEATYTANVSGVESQAVSFGEGTFSVRVTATDKATGTVTVVVKGFDEK